ncbi:MAG: class I SAM-dependent methyltransferase [bacterium]|nr:class I SAM-dependent methyltransferase [bacterium]
MLTTFLIVLEIIILTGLGIAFLLLGLPLLFTGAPFMPSYRKSRKDVLDGLFEIAKKENVKKIIDIGSGDGRVVIEFARNGFESYGIEFNPLLVWYSRYKIKRSGLKNAHIIRGDFWKTDLSEYDFVYLFQLNYVNALLTDKFKKELKTGAIIASAGFPMFDFDLIKQEGIFWVYRK